MARFCYRWTGMPEEIAESFPKDWKHLTESEAKHNFGLLHAILFSFGAGDFVSVTQWPDEDTDGMYKQWVEFIMNHPLGQKYFPYQSPQQPIVPLVVVEDFYSSENKKLRYPYPNAIVEVLILKIAQDMFPKSDISSLNNLTIDQVHELWNLLPESKIFEADDVCEGFKRLVLSPLIEDLQSIGRE